MQRISWMLDRHLNSQIPRQSSIKTKSDGIEEEFPSRLHFAAPEVATLLGNPTTKPRCPFRLRMHSRSITERRYTSVGEADFARPDATGSIPNVHNRRQVANHTQCAMISISFTDHMWVVVAVLVICQLFEKLTPS